ncbi:MAG TPA: hypothetical protein VFN43_01040 [Humibacillus sp.]|nr:hypothetical protein [Humibacillus sp.]
MSAGDAGLRLTPQETLARELIMERVAARHRAQRRRHPSRTALLLRSLADRLDRAEQSDGTSAFTPTAHPRGRFAPVVGPHAIADGPHAGQRRPWSATARRAPHRHS